MDTDKDDIINALEELSDLLSEVATSLADQDQENAALLWADVQSKFVSVSSDMKDLLDD